MMNSLEMPFLKHLDELRQRLLRVLIGVFIGFLLAFNFSEELFRFLTAPIALSFSQGQLIGTGIADAFIIKLHIAGVGGALLSCPFTFYQLWQFISPGLHDSEKQLAAPFVLASTCFFLTGVSFCYWVVFPVAFQFFSQEFLSIGTIPSLRIGECLSFSLKLLLVFGVIFELPVVSFFLARLGLVDHHWFIRNGRVAIVVIFIVAAVLTPPDVLTQILLAIPLLFLYALCIVVAYFFAKAKAK